MTEGSLRGRRIVVTRPRGQADELIALLSARGAIALDAPAIEIEPADPGPLEVAAADLVAGAYAWVVLTSVNGVRSLAGALARRGQRWPAAHARIAAIGARTAAALAGEGRSPDLVPDAFTSAALAAAFPIGEGRVLLARADIAPPGLEDALAAKGWRPHRVTAYRTRTVALSEEVLLALAAGDVDAITFASASSVDGFVAGLGEAPAWPPAVCIGPVTAAAARRHGIPIGAVAGPHTIEGLVGALEALFATAPSGGGPGPR